MTTIFALIIISIRCDEEDGPLEAFYREKGKLLKPFGCGKGLAALEYRMLRWPALSAVKEEETSGQKSQELVVLQFGWYRVKQEVFSSQRGRN